LFKLDGKVALVTGAGSGIGAAVAQVLAESGASVACADLDMASATAVADAIGAAGGEAFALGVDVTDPEANRAMVDGVVGRYGALHAAHLNAGVPTWGDIMEITIDEWDRVMAVNLRGAFLGIQACARAIADAGGGSIVVTSSAQGVMGGATGATYAASKHGLLGLMKCAAIDLARHSIRVNAVSPAGIDTPIMGPLHKNAELQATHLIARYPIGRMGQPEEVASMVAFLLSDLSAFVTGANVPIDGGIGVVANGLGPGMDIGAIIGPRD
jgi:NAD(P)-dependent dehydrogenase (short-subunit alcohol dehydrogenase family)